MLVKSISTLSEDEFNQVDEKVGRSMKELVLHQLMTNMMYYTPIEQHKELKAIHEKMKELSKDEILKEWRESDLEMAEKIENASDEDVTIPISESKSITISSEKNTLFYTDHSTFHRGQMLSSLKHLGRDGISSDYFYYVVEKNS